MDVYCRPSQIRIGLNGEFSQEGHEPNAEKVDAREFVDYCKAVKNWQARGKGLLTVRDSTYVAGWVLKKYLRVAAWIAQRFPVVIVDEAQDTLEAQFVILEAICEAGLESLELVGDPWQGLYEWRDARPDLLLEKIRDWNVRALVYRFQPFIK